jgi:hypothetical protein
MRKICFLAKDMHFRGTIRRKRTCQFCGTRCKFRALLGTFVRKLSSVLYLLTVEKLGVLCVLGACLGVHFQRNVPRKFPRCCLKNTNVVPMVKDHPLLYIYIYTHTHKHNSNLFSFIHLFLVFLSKSISSSNLISTTTLFFVFYISYNQIITTGLFCEFILSFFLYIIFS